MTMVVRVGTDEWRAWLRARMDELGYTQDSLAGESGVSQAMISKYLRLGSTPNAESVNRLARALEVSADEILDHFPAD